MSTVELLDLRLLRSFVAVAEELHFGRAATRLHIAQPPLSVQIRKLEDAVGTRLFERDRRRVALTEAGEFLLDRARQMLRESERARAETLRVARGEGGVLRIGYTPTATYEVLPRALRRFREQHPAVRLELEELRSPAQPDAVRDGRIEVGLACGPVADGADLLERVLARERFVLALPRRHALAARRTVQVAQLAREPFVLVRPELEPAWASACIRALAGAGVHPEVAQETDSKIAMLGLVAAGLGVSIVSESTMRIGREGVVFRPLGRFALRAPLVALHFARLSPRAQAFLRALGPG